MSTLSGPGPDPRLTPPLPEPPLAAFERPAVAVVARGAPTAVWVALFLALGMAVFVWLNTRRESEGGLAAQSTAGAAQGEQSAALAPTPQALPDNLGPAAPGPMYAAPPPQF